MRNPLQTFNANQTAYRGILSQLLPYVSGPYLDYLLISIDSDVTSPFRVDATSTPGLTVNVGPAIIANPQSNRNRSTSFINGLIPSFTSGTVTFPSTSGSNITTSTGGSTLLTLPSGQYAQILILVDNAGNLTTVAGSPASTPSAAIVPPPNTNTLPVAYVLLHNLGGTIQNVTQSNIFQIIGGASSSSGSSGTTLWLADEVPLSNGSTSVTVNFSTPQQDTSYIILPMLENLVDSSPQFQTPIVTNKTINGFTVQWSDPLNTANYVLSYIIPPRTNECAEYSLGSGISSLSPALFAPKGSSNYGILTVMQNLVDANPAFFNVVSGSNTTTNLSLKWNNPTDTANYQVVSMTTVTGKVSVSSGVSSIVLNLPVNYGTTVYGIVATMQNAVDANPQFQPLLITAKTNSTVTVSWPTNTDTANYTMSYYVISSTT